MLNHLHKSDIIVTNEAPYTPAHIEEHLPMATSLIIKWCAKSPQKVHWLIEYENGLDTATHNEI